MQRATLTAAWAGLVIAGTFLDGIVRLSMRAWVELSRGLSEAECGALVVLTITLTYVEGYRALQRRFAPSVAARACEAASDRRYWAILAPLYALSLVGVSGRVAARSAFGIAMIVGCVIAVRHLPAPWRGIIDAAVAVALSWGLVALVRAFVVALGERSNRSAADAQVAVHEAT